jgi:hypothetical protein
MIFHFFAGCKGRNRHSRRLTSFAPAASHLFHFSIPPDSSLPITIPVALSSMSLLR